MIKIKVPEGIRMAANEAYLDCKAFRGASDSKCLASGLEAALRWWMEEGPTISMEETLKLYDEICLQDTVRHRKSTEIDKARLVADSWQRRMFLAPEPEGSPTFSDAWNDCTVEINRVGGIRNAAEILRGHKIHEPEVPEEIANLRMTIADDVIGAAKHNELV